MGHREEYKVNVERAKSGLRHRNVRDLVVLSLTLHTCTSHLKSQSYSFNEPATLVITLHAMNLLVANFWINTRGLISTLANGQLHTRTRPNELVENLCGGVNNPFSAPALTFCFCFCFRVQAVHSQQPDLQIHSLHQRSLLPAPIRSATQDARYCQMSDTPSFASSRTLGPHWHGWTGVKYFFTLSVAHCPTLVHQPVDASWTVC